MNYRSNIYTMVSPRVNQSLSVLLMVSMIVWVLGLPGFIARADGAQLTTVTDTMTETRPSRSSNHTIAFTTPTGLTAGQTLTLTFPSAFTVGALTVGNISGESGIDVVTTCGVGTNEAQFGSVSNVITLTICTSDSIAANVIISLPVIYAGGVGVTNPSTSGSYVINIGGTMADSADIRVAIFDGASVTATVAPHLTMSIIAATSSINQFSGTFVSSGVSSTSLAFGTSLATGTAYQVGHKLSVTTNAKSGFTVAASSTSFASGSGADIDTFNEGSSVATPALWANADANSLTDDATWGHWGITSEDDTGSGEFVSNKYAGNFVGSWRTVFDYTTGPVDDSNYQNVNTSNKGHTRVGYTMQFTNLQEAAKDYTASLEYRITPIW